MAASDVARAFKGRRRGSVKTKNYEDEESEKTFLIMTSKAEKLM